LSSLPLSTDLTKLTHENAVRNIIMRNKMRFKLMLTVNSNPNEAKPNLAKAK